MKFEALRQRVKRAETVVSIRVDETRAHGSTFGKVWRAGWTPLRIVTVGLAGGFLAGRMEPSSTKFHGARWLQMIGSVSSMLASTQAAFASMQASAAADTAEEAADKVDDAADAVAQASPAPAARVQASPARPAPAPQQPHPAEAATDLSER